MILCLPIVTVCATKKYVSVTLRIFAQGLSLAKCTNMRCIGVDDLSTHLLQQVPTWNKNASLVEQTLRFHYSHLFDQIN